MSNAIKQTPLTVTGRISRFLSGPSADGYAIAKITTRNGSLTIKGRNVINAFKVGEAIRVSGEEMIHPRFGRQLQATEAWLVDEGAEGLVRWLAEAGIAEIGQARARHIVSRLGTSAVAKIIARSPDATEVLGQRLEAVRDALIPRQAEIECGAVLASYGIGRETRDRIYKTFKEETRSVIEKEPYRLVTRVNGIGFQTADKIAQAAGVAQDSEDRVIAAAIDTLHEDANDGHTWSPVADVIAGCVARTGLPTDIVGPILGDADIQSLEEVTAGSGFSLTHGWALKGMARRERALARIVREIAARPKLISHRDAAALIARHSAAIGKTLNQQQTDAAIAALVEPLVIITGLPGTGKTTVLEVITRAWIELGRTVALGSPTGKAAQRMHEATKIPASTVHRLLGVEEGEFIHNEHNPINADAIAIDESSMLDISLALSTFKAVGSAQVLLLGDSDQLPSVGPGRVFGDLIDSGVIPIIRLTEVRRQAKGSQIASAAASVRAGKMPEWADDLVFSEANDNETIAKRVLAFHAEAVAAGEHAQILTPGHAAECGTTEVNREMSGQNTESVEVMLAGGIVATVGDKVIQTVNDDDRDIYNGDSGRIIAIEEGRKTIVTVAFSGATERLLTYEGSQLRDLSPAWAISIHKSQGSEYDTVIIPLTCSHWKLLRRTLLNTGITRAKKRCIIVGQKRALMQAIKFDDAKYRRTRLRDLLNEGNS